MLMYKLYYLVFYQYNKIFVVIVYTIDKGAKL